MENEKLTFEEAVIDRLDALEEAAEKICDSLERIVDALEELNP